MFEQAKQNPDLMKGFVNTVLGEPYEEAAEAPEWQRIYERREAYPQGKVPLGGLFLTAGVACKKTVSNVKLWLGGVARKAGRWITSCWMAIRRVLTFGNN